MSILDRYEYKSELEKDCLLRWEEIGRTINESNKTPSLEKNKYEGIQSKLDCDFTLIPPKAMLALAEVAKYGETKYGGTRGTPNYRKISIDSHINHAMHHLVQYLDNDKKEDHLSHALCRLAFCVALEREAKKESGF